MEDHASKTKGLIWLIVAGLLGTAFAFGLSPLAHIIPWSWEKKFAYMVDSNYAKQECKMSPKAGALLLQLATRIYPVEPGDGAFSINIHLVNNPAVNAYAELGGEITLNSGLLKQAKSPEEIAGVLSHEIGHVQHRHILQGVITHTFTTAGVSMIFGNTSTATWGRYFLNMNFTRSQEAQADEAGLTRLQAAHVDNKGFKAFFERMEKTESGADFISDHPSNSSRLEMVSKFDNLGATPIMTEGEWKTLKTACGP